MMMMMMMMMMMIVGMHVSILFAKIIAGVSVFAVSCCFVAASFFRAVFSSPFQSTFFHSPLSRFVPGCV